MCRTDLKNSIGSLSTKTLEEKNYPLYVGHDDHTVTLDGLQVDY